jgi:orotidine-5'-phosphate decarboxylase
MDASNATSAMLARDHLALALDVADLDAALALAELLRPFFSVAKVGLELFVAEGPDVVRAMTGEGFDVFLDLKLYDIPNTVGRAASRAAAIGASYVTVHTAGGEAMVRAAVEGFRSASGREEDGSGILGVTVLTSDAVATERVLTERAALAANTGCVGIVCAAGDLPIVTGPKSSLITVVPGIRLASSSVDDQSRIATPASALEMGADLLVIGRTVTGADDPAAAAALVAAQVAEKLGLKA